MRFIGAPARGFGAAKFIQRAFGEFLRSDIELFSPAGYSAGGDAGAGRRGAAGAGPPEPPAAITTWPEEHHAKRLDRRAGAPPGPRARHLTREIVG